MIGNYVSWDLEWDVGYYSVTLLVIRKYQFEQAAWVHDAGRMAIL